MLRALLLLACTAKVAAFAQTPAGEAGCVDMDPDVIQSAFAEAIQDVEVEAVPTITSCADMASNGGCADETVSASCCASCALPQRMTYGGTSAKRLDSIGGTAYNLAECQGDCDNNNDCQAGLECFQRDGYDAVPGCGGTGVRDWDYCVSPNYKRVRFMRCMVNTIRFIVEGSYGRPWPCNFAKCGVGYRPIIDPYAYWTYNVRDGRGYCYA